MTRWSCPQCELSAVRAVRSASGPSDVDDELRAWLTMAYDAATE